MSCSLCLLVSCGLFYVFCLLTAVLSEYVGIWDFSDRRHRTGTRSRPSLPPSSFLSPLPSFPFPSFSPCVEYLPPETPGVELPALLRGGTWDTDWEGDAQGKCWFDKEVRKVRSPGLVANGTYTANSVNAVDWRLVPSPPPPNHVLQPNPQWDCIWRRG